MNLHSIPIILIRHCPMVRVSFVSALMRHSENTCQKLHSHIEACHVTAALSPNILEIRRAKFDSHHSQHVKEAPRQSACSKALCRSTKNAWAQYSLHVCVQQNSHIKSWMTKRCIWNCTDACLPAHGETCPFQHRQHLCQIMSRPRRPRPMCLL